MRALPFCSEVINRVFIILFFKKYIEKENTSALNATYYNIIYLAQKYMKSFFSNVFFLNARFESFTTTVFSLNDWVFL